MIRRIPVAGPSITRREIRYVAAAAAHAWYGGANRFHERFETAFAKYLGVRHAVSLPSCTAGIHLALAALKIGPGDEVIVPDITWIATAAPISYVGATPVFADVDPVTWCLSVPATERLITRRTRAIIPVDLYGGMPDMTALRALARRRNIAIIEDAAEAIGSEYRGRKAGTFGDAGVFSFHGSKTLTTGEGGMLVTNRTDLYRRVLVLRDHGRDPHDTQFWNREVAYKYKMSGLQAALGLAQTERLGELIARKRRMFAWYREELADLPELTLNAEPPGVLNSYWMITIVLDPATGLRKEAVATALRSRGIDTRHFFYPLSGLPAYRGLASAARARRENRVSYALSPRALNLPSALTLTRAQVRQVGVALREIVRATRRRAHTPRRRRR